jgi:mono/diheme cytochrome c family protein
LKSVLACLSLFFGLYAAAQTNHSAQIARGRYLVERVGMCGDCHTEHDQQGKPVAGKWLKGAVLPFKPTVPMPWADKSPAIAGLPGWTDAQAITFFTTGKLNGASPRPPMPEYRLNDADARALVAYLRSLAAAPASPKKESSAGSGGK